MRRAAILLSLLALVGCHRCLRCRAGTERSSFMRFTDADAPPVDSGRYPGSLRILPSDHPLAVDAAPLRADVEAHESVLRKLVRERISVKSPLEFQFMYVGQDSAKRRLILRYFSRAAVQNEIAGWQVQLVYSLPSLRPVHAYVQPLPLE
jgi:hypothetical protein